MRRYLLFLLLALASHPCAAGIVRLATDQQVVDLSDVGGLPVGWTSCAGPCSQAVPRMAIVAAGEGGMRWVADRNDAAVEVAAVHYRAEVSETPDAIVAILTATEPVAGRVLVQRYELSRRTHALRAVLRSPPGVGIVMRNGPGFVPERLPGFGAAFSDVEVVTVGESGQDAPEPAEHEIGEIGIGRGEWAGIRQRFWAWLARPAGETALVVEVPRENSPTVTWRSPAGTLDLSFYAGPVEWQSLRAVSPVLAEMLFASLWEPLRWLCFALLYLLGLIVGGVGNAGLAIILLSLAVKVILYPLTRIADGWQEDVNRAQSRIQPKIAEIRRHFRGEEAHQRTLQVYRDEGVHPLFTLKSLGGFAIQVPMFIAAFDMLADNFALSGQSFLWIADLAAPDRFLSLPFTLPFFGGDLNLLPVAMTLLTLVSALTQRDASLTPELLARQRRQLYLMAGFFFVLFYTFPAGMVLYWTANNFWHLVKVRVAALMSGPRGRDR